MAIAAPTLSAPTDLKRPVCVDLDGTLIAGDLLWESLVRLIRRAPLEALYVLLSLIRGKAHFKRMVAERVPIDPATLPYRKELVAQLETWRRQGVPLVLATATDRRHAISVATHLGLFSDVIASDGQTNLRGSGKAKALSARYASTGFHYIGNDWSDVSVWRVSADATAVAATPALARYLRAHGLVQQHVGRRAGTLRSVARALRPHQWVKNLLIVVPLITSHQIFDSSLWAATIFAVLAFSLAASAVYLLNDIIDIESDRQHPRKCKRPFAVGDLSIPMGVALAAGMFTGAVAVAAIAVSWTLAAVVLGYLALTSAYSLVLKRQPVTDVFTLTGLYVLRIVAGGVATGIVLSSWLLAFALFLFLSLAFVKRYVELTTIKGQLPGRGYGTDDALWMHAIGTSAGYMSVLVLALYVHAPETAQLYARPQALWGLSPLLLFWLTRLWFRAGRKAVHDDPVVDALKDPTSYIVLLLAAGIVLAAI
jgi:4-hydroxybenzoate polyprenyltransferase